MKRQELQQFEILASEQWNQLNLIQQTLVEKKQELQKVEAEILATHVKQESTVVAECHQNKLDAKLSAQATLLASIRTETNLKPTRRIQPVYVGEGPETTPTSNDFTRASKFRCTTSRGCRVDVPPDGIIASILADIEGGPSAPAQEQQVRLLLFY